MMITGWLTMEGFTKFLACRNVSFKWEKNISSCEPTGNLAETDLSAQWEVWG